MIVYSIVQKNTHFNKIVIYVMIHVCIIKKITINIV